MEVLDPRFALIAGIGSAMASERVRRTVGRGAGYVAKGALYVGGPVIHAGQEIFEEAREVAAPHNGAGAKRAPRSKAAA